MTGQTYMPRRRADTWPDAPASQPRAQGPSLQALRAGAAPSQEQLGSKIDLPGAIREKMENSFGADLSSVRLYESQTVADAGAQAMAMGNRIAFAPGQLDFTSTAGQSLLGHELSHVVSQARGEVTGSGFLNDSALEARADQEGAMAAAGENIYAGPVTPLSMSSAAPAAGPMQASKFGSKKPEPEEDLEISEPTLVRGGPGPVSEDGGKRVFQSSQNYALHQIVSEATPEQIRSNPQLQQLVLNNFNSTMSQKLQGFNGSSKEEAFSHCWRGDSMGEMKTYNEMLKKLVGTHMDKFHIDENADASAETDRNINLATDMVESDETLGRMITGAKGAFEGSVHYQDEGAQSTMLMNNLVLRALAPQIVANGQVALSKNLQKRINSSGASANSEMAKDSSDAGRRFLGTAKRLWNRK